MCLKWLDLLILSLKNRENCPRWYGQCECCLILAPFFSSICARNLFFLDVEVKLISFVLLSGSYFLGSGILFLLCFWIELNLFISFYSMLSSFSFPLSFSIPDLKFNYFLIYFFFSCRKKSIKFLLFFTYFCYYHG